MPFGLCNAPTTFERLMDRVLQGLRWLSCLVYLDDIISFGTTFLDALDNLTLIFERLRSYGMWNMWLLIAAVLLDLHRDVIAQRNVICWLLCIQFRSYLRGTKFTLRTDHKSLVWLHWFKDTEGMMARWLHALQQFQFSNVHLGPVESMETLTASLWYPRHRVDSVLVWIAHRLIWKRNLSINLLIMSRPVARRTQISYLYTQGRTGWHY